MKKKLTIILASFLVLLLAFTFVACNKDDDNNTPTNDAFSAVTAAEKEAMNETIKAYIANWAELNAAEEGYVTDQSASLETALTGANADKFTFVVKNGTKTSKFAPTVKVSFDQKTNTYSVQVGWNKGAYKPAVFTQVAKTVVYDNWAGKYSRSDGCESAEVGDVFETILNAVANTANYAASEAQDINLNAQAIVAVDVEGQRYALKVAGKLNKASINDTELGLTIINFETGKELFGIYYDAAENDEDCKLYIGYYDEDEEKVIYKYIDFASEIKNKLKDIPSYTFGEDDEIDLSGISGKVGGVLEMLGATAYTKEGVGNTTYMIDLNLGNVLSQVSNLVDSLLGGGEEGGLDLSDFGLGDLDLVTMNGLRGHITIAAVVTGDEDEEIISDAELAVNIPENCVFKFSDKANARSIEIPAVNFALSVNDFVIADDIDVLPKGLADAEYFSPANIELGGDIYINYYDGVEKKLDSTFRYELSTDVNPFKPSKSSASLTILQSKGTTFDKESAKNFLSVYYEQADKTVWLSGTALRAKDDDGTTLYAIKYDKAGRNEIKAWLGYGLGDENNFETILGVSIDQDGKIVVDDTKATAGAKAIFEADITQHIISYYNSKVAENNDDTSAAGFDISNISKYVSAIKDLYKDLQDEGVIVIDTEAGSFKADVNAKSINDVISVINDLFGTTIDDLSDPEYVKVYFNTEDYADQLYITVKYGKNVYTLLCDDSKEDQFTIDFTMVTDTRTYTCNVLAEDDEESKCGWRFTVNFENKTKAGEKVMSFVVSWTNATIVWGAKNDEHRSIPVKTLTADQKEGAVSFFKKDGLSTDYTQKIMKKLGNKNSAVYPFVEYLADFIVRQIVG